MTSASMKTEAGLEQLNGFLASRAYIGSEVEATEEDFRVRDSLSSAVDKEKFPHIWRWSRNLGALKTAYPLRKYPAGTKLTLTAGSVAAAPANAAGAPPAKQEAAPAKQQAAPKDAKKAQEKKDAKPAAPATAPVAAGDGGDEDDAAAAKLQLLVGKVTKVWPHEGSDKLFCEEIDCGEGQVRQIGSGLRHFYKAEEFEGRMVIVVANLKPKKLAGFESNGMVLCASSADHSDVKFVEVPAGAKVGDRVIFGDLPMEEPAAPNVCEKKKLYVKVQPHFVAKGGTCYYKDKPFTLPSGICTAPVADGYALS